MTQAAARGIIDLAGFDSRDRQWRRRLGWAMQFIERELQREHHKVLHRHHLARMMRPGVTWESADENARQASTHLLEYSAALFPWQADQFTGADTPASEADAKAYHAVMGESGSPEYTLMLSELQRLKKLSPAEKEFDRQRRRQQQTAKD